MQERASGEDEQGSAHQDASSMPRMYAERSAAAIAAPGEPPKRGATTVAVPTDSRAASAIAAGSAAGMVIVAR
jgi:hypothetical protein